MLEQKQFARETMRAAREAAEAWWAEQTGLTRVSEYTSPANLADKAGPRWLATIIYEETRKPR